MAKKLKPTQSLFRWIVRRIFGLFYRVRVFGHDKIPAEGPALLVSNHISWLDGPVVMMLTKRPLRTIVYSGNFQNPLLRWWANTWGIIQISGGPKAIVRALKTANEALKNNEMVLIFAEGGISRSGQVQSFRPGVEKIIKGTNAPIVPVCIDELWGSIFTYDRGKFFWKIPKRWRFPISLHYGDPIPEIQSVQDVRQAVQQLSASVVKERIVEHMSLPYAMLRMCKRRRFAPKIADSNTGETTGGNLLLRTLILRRLLKRHVLDANEKYVGVLLPPSNGGVIANMALSLDKRVPVNLNYTVSSEVMNECIKTAGIKRVITSRQVMSKLDLKLDAEIVELENFKEKVTLGDKVAGALGAFVTPAWMLSAQLGLGSIKLDDEATVIFTSGSTGTPKGVILTYANVASNVEAIDQVVHLTSKDTIVGILPFFHSFGYTVTMWTPLALDIKAIYHYSPLDAKRIGMMVKKHKATVLLSTPTFLRSFLKRCSAEQFKTLDVIVAGAEKLPIPLCDAYEEKYGVRPVEGYGCTELSPLVSVNVPHSRSSGSHQKDRCEGSVGRPIPNVAAKTVDPETYEDLPVGEPGMLMIKGPNVMKGYMEMPEKTAEVVRDGWYVTGDLARIDKDGFIHITGRESRFSKIGGEMVPHIKIEETLAELIGADEEEGLKAAVTAVPDEKKGERLIVLHTAIDKSIDDLRAGLSEAGLPNIFIPSSDSFIEIAEMPVLGTGKLDLKGLKQTALEKVGC